MIVRQTFSVGRPIKSDQTDGLSQLFELEARDGEALRQKRKPIELEAIHIQIQVFSPPYDIKPAPGDFVLPWNMGGTTSCTANRFIYWIHHRSV